MLKYAYKNELLNSYEDELPKMEEKMVKKLAEENEDFLQNLIYNTRTMWMLKRGLSER